MISPETEHFRKRSTRKYHKKPSTKPRKRSRGKKIKPKGFDATDDERTLTLKVERLTNLNSRAFDATDDE